ncbi:MAG: efflux RND transporter periplasmic adaptor subunit [Pseudomonadota bacterium]
MRQILLFLVSLTAAFPAAAETLIFEGRVEAWHQAELSSQLGGVVEEILFEAGDRITAGQPMIRLDATDAKLALASAEARVALAKAELAGATREANRQEHLFERGISPDAVVGPALTAKAAAEANLQLANAERARAQVDLERTLIRAPIAGFAEPPSTVTGAFLEAEAGSPLGRIVALDPVVIAYRVPYATRLATRARTGATTLDDMFAQITLSIFLMNGETYGHETRPDHASASVDPVDGTVTVRAMLPNPDKLLRPGMMVTVHSRVNHLETQ